MSALRHDRNKGRKAAVQLLYAAELTGVRPALIAEKGAAPEELALDEYAMELVAGVDKHRKEIDALLNSASENWSLTRMPLVDRCIMRVAVYEMQHVSIVPVAVTINEAVELAKDFGGEDESHRFVNGVLGRIASLMAGMVSSKKGEQAPSAASEGDAAGEDAESVASQEGTSEEA